jgi:dTDP-4-amino-4,6-dideoxygalactose transaminase
MKNTFWIGIWPGITQEDLEYVADKFKEFIFINQKMESKS